MRRTAHLDRGATSVEYALLIALIAAVIFGGVLLFGGGVFDLFDDANTSINDGVTK